MNGKTSRMLNQMALLMGQSPKKVKQIWNATPSPERAKSRYQIWRFLSKHPDRLDALKTDGETRKEKNRQQFLKFIKPYRDAEAKAEEKARKLKMKRKNKAQKEAVGYGFFGGLLGWFGGIFNGKK